jgi:hypothetical protein
MFLRNHCITDVAQRGARCKARAVSDLTESRGSAQWDDSSRRGGGDLGIGGAISESADGLLRKIGIAAGDEIVSVLSGVRDR